MMLGMRWLAILSGSRQDVDRLYAESLEGLSADESTPDQLILEVLNPEADAVGEEAPHAAKAVIDASVRHINGFGKLRWGRAFAGVSISDIKSVDSAGRVTQRVFAEPAYDHMLPEEFADLVERLGRPRPALPVGIDVVNALEFAAVKSLAESNPDVARVLHLLDLMLAGDDEIDWVAGYAALEVIEQDLADRQLDGQALGWWSNTERRNFKATANSAEVLGFRARHGKRSGLADKRMSTKQANWFVRRVAAHWLTYLLTTSSQP